MRRRCLPCAVGTHTLRLRSVFGNVTDRSVLVSFLYELMRDHLLLGVVEELVLNSPPCRTVFTNGWLAQYAQDVATRLVQQTDE